MAAENESLPSGRWRSTAYPLVALLVDLDLFFEVAGYAYRWAPSARVGVQYEPCANGLAIAALARARVAER